MVGKNTSDWMHGWIYLVWSILESFIHMQGAMGVAKAWAKISELCLLPSYIYLPLPQLALVPSLTMSCPVLFFLSSSSLPTSLSALLNNLSSQD